MGTRRQQIEATIKMVEATKKECEQFGNLLGVAQCENTLLSLRKELQQIQPQSNRKLSIEYQPNSLIPNLGVIHHHRKHSTGNKIREILSVESILNGERGRVLRERVVAMMN